jgi:chaperonin GroES
LWRFGKLTASGFTSAVVARLKRINCQLATPALKSSSQIGLQIRTAHRFVRGYEYGRPLVLSLPYTPLVSTVPTLVTCRLRGADLFAARRLEGMMKLRPLHDRVVIKRAEEQEQVRGGIIIPDTAKEKPQQGDVIAVGDGKILQDGSRIPLDIKEGDRVLFGKYSGTEVKIEEEEFLIMREDEILGRIEQTEKTKSAKK